MRVSVEYVVYVIVALIIPLVYILVIKSVDRQKWYREEAYKKRLVKWCVIPRSWGSALRACDLYEYVEEMQQENNIKQEYRISGREEWEIVEDVIEIYRQNLITEYAYDQVVIPKTKKEISGQDFFMYSLLEYLRKETLNCRFHGHELHSERLEYKEYGAWGGQLFLARYAITDYAVVIYKLYYVLYVASKNNKALNPQGNLYDNEKFLVDILETKTVQIERI